MSIEGGDARINVAESGGKNYEVNRDFGVEMDTIADRALDQLSGEGSTFALGSEAYNTVKFFADKLDASVISFHTNNTQSLNFNSYDYSSDLESLLRPILRDALSGEGNTARTESLLQGYVDVWDEGDSGDIAGGSGDDDVVGGAGDDDLSDVDDTDDAGSFDMDDVIELLDEAKDADTSAEKADLLSSAIDAMIEELEGGGSGGESGDGGSDSPPTDDVEILPDDMIGGGEGTDEVPGGEGGDDLTDPEVEPEPEMQVVTNRFEGQDLMDISTANRGDLTFDDSDWGIGIDSGSGEADEVNNGEKLEINLPDAATSGKVDFVDLHGSDSVAVLYAYEGDNLVETVSVVGDEDGNVTADISVPFDRIEVRADLVNGKSGTDFGVSGVTIEREVPAEGSEGTEGADGSGGGEGAGGAGDDTFEFSTDDLITFLEALSALKSLIEASDLSEGDMSALLDALTGAMVATAEAVSGDEGAGSLTRDDLIGILSSVQTVANDANAAIGESDDKSDTFDALIASTRTFVEALSETDE